MNLGNYVEKVLRMYVNWPTGPDVDNLMMNIILNLANYLIIFLGSECL